MQLFLTRMLISFFVNEVVIFVIDENNENK